MSHLIKKPRSVKKDTEPYLPYFDCVLPLYFMGEGGGRILSILFLGVKPIEKVKYGLGLP